jgi:hypothetical protein
MSKKIITEIKPTKGGNMRLNIAPSSAPSIFAVMESIQAIIVKNSRTNIPNLLMVIPYYGQR